MNRSKAIQNIVEEYGPKNPTIEENPTTLPLALPSFGKAEVEEALDALLSGWLTMGKRVFQFEKDWADYIGTKHAIAVNSGSSALLVMLSALIECGDLKKGQEVIVPAVGWSTSLFSVAQAGLVPVLADVDAKTLSLSGRYDRPVLAIHMLGNPACVESPLLMEDACGAHGAKIGEKKAGSIGVCGAFSFFFSHHITTGEGGMITTDRDDLADACRSIRAHGWIRERSDAQEWIEAYPNIDSRFLFASAGFNMRMTEISGAFGIHQVKRMEEFVRQRNENHRIWCELIEAANLPIQVFPEMEGTRHAAFGFPLVLTDESPLSRDQLSAFLEEKNIQTRPISGANLAIQPAFAKLDKAIILGDLPIATRVQERGIFVGQSHGFSKAHGLLLLRALQEAFAET